MPKKKRAKDSLSLSTFTKTAAIFSELLDRKIDIVFTQTTQAFTNGHVITIPRRLRHVGINDLNYDIYVIFEHELAHILFATDFSSLAKFIKEAEKTYGDNEVIRGLAHMCYNIVEDIRVNSCWNLIYMTPFDRIGQRVFIIPRIQRGKKLTLMDIVMDVSSNFIRNTKDEYLEYWKFFNDMFQEVRGIVIPTATHRVAKKLLEFLLQNLDKFELDIKADAPCKKDRKNVDREGRKRMKKLKITFDPNVSGPSKSFKDIKKYLTKEQLEQLMQHLKRYQYLRRNSQLNSDKKYNINADAEGARDLERKISEQEIARLRQKLIGEYEEEDPLKGIIGEVKFTRFSRSERFDVNTRLRVRFPFKKRAIRWLDESGDEIDIDEYIQKTIFNTGEMDFFEDELEVRGMDVIFLVDFSGSMSGWNEPSSKEFMLKQTIYTLWKSIEELPGASVKTIIYSGSYEASTPMEIIEDPEEILVVSPGGATHTYRALDYVYRILKREKNRSRFVFLLTDGYPTPDAVVQNPYAYVRRVVNKIRREGISLFTIFIETYPPEEEILRHFGDKRNTIWLPPEKLEQYLTTEVVKLMRMYVKAM